MSEQEQSATQQIVDLAGLVLIMALFAAAVGVMVHYGL